MGATDVERDPDSQFTNWQFGIRIGNWSIAGLQCGNRFELQLEFELMAINPNGIGRARLYDRRPMIVGTRGRPNRLFSVYGRARFCSAGKAEYEEYRLRVGCYRAASRSRGCGADVARMSSLARQYLQVKSMNWNRNWPITGLSAALNQRIAVSSSRWRVDAFVTMTDGAKHNKREDRLGSARISSARFFFSLYPRLNDVN